MSCSNCNPGEARRMELGRNGLHTSDGVGHRTTGGLNPVLSIYQVLPIEQVALLNREMPTITLSSTHLPRRQYAAPLQPVQILWILYRRLQ